MLLYMYIINMSSLLSSQPGLELDTMTLEQYIELNSDEQSQVQKAVQSAVQLAIKKNFDLYMTYDCSVEARGGSIPGNMLINAVIHLAHQQYSATEILMSHQRYSATDRTSSYQSKGAWYYRNYYGESCWKRSLDYLDQNLSAVFQFAAEKSNARYFQHKKGLIEALDHANWILIYAPKYDRSISLPIS